MTFQVGDKILKQDGADAGADFFRMFSYPLLEGTAESALKGAGEHCDQQEDGGGLFWQPRGGHREDHP